MEGAGCRDRGIKRTREESDDASGDDSTNIHLEVTTGEGVTVKPQLPPTATVLMVKQEVESELGIKPREAIVFSSNKAHTEKLPDEETLDSLLAGEEAKLKLFKIPQGPRNHGARLVGASIDLDLVGGQDQRHLMTMS
jgi:hypothetical protein